MSIICNLFINVIVCHRIGLGSLFSVLISSTGAANKVVLVMTDTSLFSFMYAGFNVTGTTSRLLTNVTRGRFAFLLVMGVVFLVTKYFVSTGSTVCVFMPVVLPMYGTLNCSIMTFNIVTAIGLTVKRMAPPMNMGLFITVDVGVGGNLRIALRRVSETIVPVVTTSITILLVVACVPTISATLPGTLTGRNSCAKSRSSSARDRDSGSSKSKDSSFGAVTSCDSLS